MSRNYGCRITENISINGVNALVMENQKLRVTILIDKGADIYELLYKPKDIDFMWRSPNELISASKYGQYSQDSVCNYIDLYSGGWQEIIPNGGPSCTYKGAELGMHGEVVNVPWSYNVVEDNLKEISICFYVTTRRSPYTLEKRITIKEYESIIYFEETLSNNGDEDMELMWGQHPTIGKPFLDEHCHIITSARQGIIDGPAKDFKSQRLEPGQTFVWPKGISGNNEEIDFSKVPGEESKTADMIYLTDFSGEAFYEVVNTKRQLAFGMKWDKSVFPYIWLWQVCNGADGYPWYGQTYNMAIEPWTSYPSKGLNEAINNGSSFTIRKRSKVKTGFSCYIKEISC